MHAVLLKKYHMKAMLHMMLLITKQMHICRGSRLRHEQAAVQLPVSTLQSAQWHVHIGCAMLVIADSCSKYRAHAGPVCLFCLDLTLSESGI